MLELIIKVRRQVLLIERYQLITENIIKMKISRKGQLITFPKFMKGIYKNRCPNFTISVPDPLFSKYKKRKYPGYSGVSCDGMGEVPNKLREMMENSKTATDILTLMTSDMVVF